MSQINTLKNLIKLSNKYDESGQFLKANLIDEKIIKIKDGIIIANSKRYVEHYMSLPEKETISKEAREWIKDCEWANIDDEEIDELSDLEVLSGIENHYDGGLRQFVKDCLIDRI